MFRSLDMKATRQKRGNNNKALKHNTIKHNTFKHSKSYITTSSQKACLKNSKAREIIWEISVVPCAQRGYCA